MAKASEWAKRVAEWRESGLTAKEYAAPRGWSSQSLLQWSSVLKKRERLQGSRPEGTKAVEMVPVKRTAQVSSVPLTLRVGEAELDILPGVDPTLLRDVVTVMREVK